MCKVINSEDKNNSLFSSEIVILADQYASTCENSYHFIHVLARRALMMMMMMMVVIIMMIIVMHENRYSLF